MTILRKDTLKEYTVIPNSTIRDERLRLQDIGMLCFMMSMPDGWKLTSKNVEEHLKNDDKNTVIESLKKLKETGYIALDESKAAERTGKIATVSPAPAPLRRTVAKLPQHRNRPTLEEVSEYCKERKNGIDPVAFMDFYDTNGWVQGKGKPIKDWKAAVRTWEQRRKGENKRGEKYQYQYGDLSKYTDILDGFDG